MVLFRGIPFVQFDIDNPLLAVKILRACIEENLADVLPLGINCLKCARRHWPGITIH